MHATSGSATALIPERVRTRGGEGRERGLANCVKFGRKGGATTSAAKRRAGCLRDARHDPKSNGADLS